MAVTLAACGSDGHAPATAPRSTTTSVRPTGIDQLVLTTSDLPQGWTGNPPPPDSPASTTRRVNCLGLSTTQQGSSFFRGLIFTDGAGHFVGTIGERWPSATTAREVQRIEESTRYLNCLHAQRQRELSTSPAVLSARDVSTRRLDRDISSGEIGVRTTYTVDLKAHGKGRAVVDDIVLWKPPFRIGVQFYGFRVPFPAALQHTLLQRLRALLQAAH